MAQSVFPDGLAFKSRHLSRAFTEPGRTQSGISVICYVTQADNSVLQVEVEHRAFGKELLEKICRQLGIVDEADYFGIQYMSPKSELLWINVRNRLSKQMPSAPPYHFYFRVKYFIRPEDLLLEGTRHQFYINVVRQMKEGLWDAEIPLETQANVIALMAYVQFGKYNQKTTPCKYACFWPDSRGEIPPDAIRLAAHHHQNLEGRTVQHVQYELLRLVATEVPSYGMYFYDVKDIFENRLLFGVGPEGLVLCTPNYTVEDRVQTITTTSRVITLKLLEDDGSARSRNYQLSSPRLANALYRAVNEVYAFFQCATVREEVLSQTRRDLLDTISRHHNGKEYAFDVQRTAREVYDHARRNLYHCTNNTNPQDSVHHPLGPLSSSPTDLFGLSSLVEPDVNSASGDIGGGGALKGNYISRADSIASDEKIQEIVRKCLLEIGLCRLCVDAPINRVFLPCGHIICCAECAERIKQCSVCRQDIVERHQCFLPWETEPSLDQLVHSESRRIRRQSTRSEASSSVRSSPSAMIHHTASAPTCTLFSLPSTTCVDPSIPMSRNVSDDNLTVDSMASSRMDATNNAAQPILSVSSTETPTPCATPVHKSKVRSPSSDPSGSSEETHVNVLRNSSTVASEVSSRGANVELSAASSPNRHVTWQLND